jgi:hypothetical protein
LHGIDRAAAEDLPTGPGYRRAVTGETIMGTIIRSVQE